MTKIGMVTNQMSLRGTEVALYDYAIGCMNILGLEPIIFFNKNSSDNNIEVLRKFKEKMDVISFEDNYDLNKSAEKSKINSIYAIKDGRNDGFFVESVPNLIHAVFPITNFRYHGTALNYVSEWLSLEYGGGLIDYVPHIVSLPQARGNLRKELNIPGGATVFGCYGGQNSFDIEFVYKNVIPEILQKRRDIYFIFMNIKINVEHERVIRLPGTANNIIKAEFINTCDAMIHARRLGESFGLSCFEFMSFGKPIITYRRSKQRNHIHAYPTNPYLYSGPSDLKNILMNFDRKNQSSSIWKNIAENLSERSVMNQFHMKFINNITCIHKMPLNMQAKILTNHALRKLRRYMDPIFDYV